MSEAVLAALLLTFAASIGYNAFRIGVHNCSQFTHQVFGLVATGGAIAAFAAVYLFLHELGVYGLIYWVVSTAVFLLIIPSIVDGIRSMLALGSLIVGGFLAFQSVAF
jgi:hypothetical protein